MAVSPDKKNESAAGLGNDPDVESLLDRVSEMELLIQDMAATIQTLQNAAIGRAGLDPEGAARRAMGRQPVQFLRHYNRLPMPSTVAGAPHVVEGYTVAAFEVVLLRKDELQRIKGDFPDLIQDNPAKFVDQAIHRPYLGKDDNGRPIWTTKTEVVNVKTLVDRAPPVG